MAKADTIQSMAISFLANLKMAGGMVNACL